MKLTLSQDWQSFLDKADIIEGQHNLNPPFAARIAKTKLSSLLPLVTLNSTKPEYMLVVSEDKSRAFAMAALDPKSSFLWWSEIQPMDIEFLKENYNL